MCTRLFLVCRPGARRLYGDGENMNNIASYTGAIQEEAALEEDEEEKLKHLEQRWLPGWLVNGCPRKLCSENNLAGKQTIDAAFSPSFSYSPSSNEQLRTIAGGCSPLRAAGDPLSRHAASGRTLTSV